MVTGNTFITTTLRYDFELSFGNISHIHIINTLPELCDMEPGDGYISPGGSVDGADKGRSSVIICIDDMLMVN